MAYLALEEVERIDRERERQVRAIAEAEAVVSEWSGPPDMDAALDFYNEIVATLQGLLASAGGVGDLN